MAGPRRTWRTCRKCGSQELAVRYIEAGGNRWHLARADEHCRDEAEHLHWTCLDCKHDWREPPRDAVRPRKD